MERSFVALGEHHLTGVQHLGSEQIQLLIFILISRDFVFAQRKR